MANLNSFFIYSLPIFLLLIFCAQFCHSFSISSILFGSDEEDTNDPDRPLMCYRGIKYFIGQEEINDNIKCEGNLLEKTAGMNKYCYKFTSNSAGTKFVKRGCSVMICTPLGKGCTKMAFEGVQGEMCCCSDTSYCNGTKLHRMNGGLGIMALILAFSIIAFILI